MKGSARRRGASDRAGSAPYQSAFGRTVNPQGSGVDGRLGRLGRRTDRHRLFGRGNLRRGREGDDFLGKPKGEGDFLGDGGLFLAHANLALEGSQRRLEALRLDREAQYVARPADSVAAHAFARSKENGPVVDRLARLADLAFEEEEHGELAEGFQH